jgi:hypothetical protein
MAHGVKDGQALWRAPERRDPLTRELIGPIFEATQEDRR